MLTQQRLKELLVYNTNTGFFHRRESRGGRRQGMIAGGRGTCGYVEIKIDGKAYKAHRLAYLYVRGCWPENFIDHINGLRSDNAWRNLRPATYAENQRNRQGVASNNSTGFTGVCWHKNKRKFQAYIYVQKRMIHLGKYSECEDAIKARRAAELEHFGPFAPRRAA